MAIFSAMRGTVRALRYPPVMRRIPLRLWAFLPIVLALTTTSPSGIPEVEAQSAVPVVKGVQTGTVVFGNGAGSGQVSDASATITLGKVVDDTKAFVYCTFSTTQTNPNTRPTCELTSTQVVITLGTTIAASAHTTVRWYVAEFEAGVSVKRGVATFTTTGLDAATASAEPLSAVLSIGASVTCTKSFVLTTERIALASANADEQWQAGATLVTTNAGSAPRAVCTSGTTSFLELFRSENSANGTPLKVAWQVVEMDGTTVQRGRACIGGTGGTTPCSAANGASVTAALTTVTPSKTLVLMTQRAGSAIAGDEGRYRTRVDLNAGGTQLTFTRGISSTTNNENVHVTWEVVAFDDTNSIRVERNTAGTGVSMGGGTGSSNSAAFTTVTQGRTLPMVSASYGNSGNGFHDDSSITVQTNQTTLTFARAATSNTLTVNWQAVQFFGCDTDATLCHVSVSALSGTTSDTASARLSWWPVYHASGSQCFAAGTGAAATEPSPAAPSICNILIARWTGTSTLTWTPVNNTQYISGRTTNLVTTCAATGAGAGTASAPCIVHRGTATTGAAVTFATDSPLPNDGSTRVNYKFFVQTGAPNTPTYVTLSDSLSLLAVTPKIYSTSTGGQQWTYHASGGSILNAPYESSTGIVYANSNNHKVYVIDSGTGQEVADPVVTPASPLGAITWWPPLAVNHPSESQVVFGDQAGYVTSFDGATGKRQWTRRIHTDPTDSTLGNVQASPVVQSQRYANQAFKNAYNSATYGNYTGDVLFVATSNINDGSNQNKNNKIYALRSTDGTTLWTFSPNTDATNCSPVYPMDVVLNTPGVDYNLNYLFVTSQDGPTAGQNSLWVVNTLGPATSGPADAVCRGLLPSTSGTLLDSEMSLWMSYDQSTFYFQSSNGLLRAYDTTGTPRIAGSGIITGAGIGTPGFKIKSSFWQDYDKFLLGQARLYFVVQDGGLWCIDDLGSDFDICPEWNAVPTYQNALTTKTVFAFPMLMEPRLWLPGGDNNSSNHEGRGVLFQISTADGSLQKTFTVNGPCTGSGASADCGSALGDISVSSFNYDALYFGNAAGKLFRVNLNGNYGSLP